MFLVRAARFGLVFSGLRRLVICMIQPFKTSVRRMRIIMCKCARENLPARDESPGARDKSAALQRFSNSRGVTGVVKGGFYFHPSDEDLSPGTPVVVASD